MEKENNGFAGYEAVKNEISAKTGNLLFLKETVSTNSFLKEHRSEYESGYAVAAYTQTSGRGRLGRRFESPAGQGIYVSLLFRTSDRDLISSVTPCAAVAVCDTIRQLTGADAGIKWVNDILIGGRKVCGILAESVFSDDGSADLILGVGFDLYGGPEDFPAELRDTVGTLESCTGKRVDYAGTLDLLVGNLRKIPEMTGVCLDAYRKACVTVGKEISIIPHGGGNAEIRRGFAGEICEDYSLLVRFPDGSTEKIRSGEVSIKNDNNREYKYGEIPMRNHLYTVSGSEELVKAASEIANLKAEEYDSITIQITGDCNISEPVCFSGVHDLRITSDKENKIGSYVDLTGSKYDPKQGSDRDREMLSVFPESARDGVIGLKIGDAAAPNYYHTRGTDLPANRIYVGGVSLEPARWPNNLGENSRDGEYLNAEWVVHDGDPKTGDFHVTYDDRVNERVKGWNNSGEIRMFSYLWNKWSQSWYIVDSFDTENKTFTVLGGTGNFHFNPEDVVEPRRFFFSNLPEELDAPGEYYYDRESGTVYFIPPKGAASDAPIILEQPHDCIFRFENCENVSVSGVDFEYFGGIVLRVNGCRGFYADHFTMRHISLHGIDIVSSERITIRDFEITDAGRGGISLLGCGDRKKLISSHTLIENGSIHDYTGIYKVYCGAIRPESSIGITVRNCEFYNSQHQVSMLIHCSDVTFENNYIHDVCLDTDDAAAIYWDLDPTNLGIRIVGNRFCNIGNREAVWSTAAIYIDDSSVGGVIENNLFFDCALIAKKKKGVNSGSKVIDLNEAEFMFARNNVFIGTDPDEKACSMLGNHEDYRWLACCCGVPVGFHRHIRPWFDGLNREGFFTDVWKNHYKGTPWEAMFTLVSDRTVAMMRELEEKKVPYWERDEFLLNALWDHKDKEGKPLKCSLREYVMRNYGDYVEQISREQQEIARGFGWDYLHNEGFVRAVCKLIDSGEIRIYRLNTFTRNAVFGVDREYLAPDGSYPNCGMAGWEYNYASSELQTADGSPVYTGEGRDLKLTEAAVREITEKLPDFDSSYFI